MRNHNRFATVFCFLGFFLISLSQANSTPQTSKVDYTDYLPKYRTLSDNFLISKIDYTKEDIVVFFRYVANKDNDVVNFYGANKELSWKLTTSTRSETSSAYTITKPTFVKNIRLNDETKVVELEANASQRVSAQIGDIITCEVHFELMPHSIRTIHLIGGDLGEDGTQRFNCNDILLKSKDSKILGTEEQMEATIQHFYAQQVKVNYPNINTTTTLAGESSSDEKEDIEESTENPLAKSLEPIDYMPKSLTSIKDMTCNERVILSNIYFQDNKSEFVGRVKVMKTINMIVDYLTFHPKAKIVLHGHTDIFGDEFKNLELSQKRVFTVKRTIVGKGIDANRIITIHHGGTQPLIQYKNGSEMNRRVEAEVLCSGTVANTTLETLNREVTEQ